MHSLKILSLLPVALLLFLVSLIIVMVTSAWFTRRLEALCEMFGLSIGMLSLLSAIGANIPNYVASAVAIMSGHVDVGIGIIVGSSVYNIAIILGICTLASPAATGIALNAQESQDARGIAWYALAMSERSERRTRRSSSCRVHVWSYWGYSALSSYTFSGALILLRRHRLSRIPIFI